MGCLPGLAATEELLFPDRKIKILGENILIWQKKKFLLVDSHTEQAYFWPVHPSALQAGLLDLMFGWMQSGYQKEIVQESWNAVIKSPRKSLQSSILAFQL